MKKTSLVISCLVFFSSLLADLPSPYNEVDVLPYNPQGWYQNGPSMEWIIRRSLHESYY